MSINYGTFSLGQSSPYFQAIYEARVAAFFVWQVIAEVKYFRLCHSHEYCIALFS
jgi:hypothetical protein